MVTIDRTNSSRFAYSEAEGYSVQDHRLGEPTSDAAYEELRALAAELEEPLYIRCSFWWSGRVETAEGYGLTGLDPNGALAKHVAFRAPGG